MHLILILTSSILTFLPHVTAQLPNLSTLPQCVQDCVPQALAMTECTTLTGTPLLTCVCHGTNGSRFSDTLIACLLESCGSDAEQIIFQAAGFCDNAPADGIVILSSTSGGGTGVTGPATMTSGGNISRSEPTGSVPTSSGGAESSTVISRGEPPVGSSSSQAVTSVNAGETTRVVSEPTSTTSGARSSTTATGAAAAVVGVGRGCLKVGGIIVGLAVALV